MRAILRLLSLGPTLKFQIIDAKLAPRLLSDQKGSSENLETMEVDDGDREREDLTVPGIRCSNFRTINQPDPGARSERNPKFKKGQGAWCSRLVEKVSFVRSRNPSCDADLDMNPARNNPNTSSGDVQKLARVN